MVTVMPRTSDAATVWRGKLIPAVYDYRHLGRVADRVRVMAYDQHAGRCGPGTTTSDSVSAMRSCRRGLSRRGARR